MKKIDMYVRGNTYKGNEGIKGQYIVILEYGNNTKILSGDNKNSNVTDIRMIIEGTIIGLRALKESCIIDLYTHTHMGLGKIRNKNNKYLNDNSIESPNKDALIALKRELITGDHEINEFVSRKKQDFLIRKLKANRKN